MSFSKKIISAILFFVQISVFLLFPLSRVRAEENLYFIHQDHLGSNTAVTDSEGNVISKSRYYPYGTERASTGDQKITEKKYTGQRKDAETGLYYYNARYYDPALSTFISADNVDAGMNKYAYAGGNPIMYSDPSGNFPGLGILLGAAGLILGYSVLTLGASGVLIQALSPEGAKVPPSPNTQYLIDQGVLDPEDVPEVTMREVGIRYQEAAMTLAYPAALLMGAGQAFNQRQVAKKAYLDRMDQKVKKTGAILTEGGRPCVKTQGTEGTEIGRNTPINKVEVVSPPIPGIKGHEIKHLDQAVRKFNSMGDAHISDPADLARAGQEIEASVAGLGAGIKYDTTPKDFAGTGLNLLRIFSEGTGLGSAYRAGGLEGAIGGGLIWIGAMWSLGEKRGTTPWSSGNGGEASQFGPFDGPYDLYLR